MAQEYSLSLRAQDSIKVAVPMATNCHWPKAQDSEASTRGFIYVLGVQCQNIKETLISLASYHR